MEKVEQALAWAAEQLGNIMATTAGAASCDGDPTGALEMCNSMASDAAINLEMAIEATRANDKEIARLRSALLAILGPLAELPDNPNVKDDTCVPLDVYMGELRQAWASLKDAS